METFLLFFLVSSLFSHAYAVDSLRFLVIGDMGGIPVEPYSTYVERTTATEMGKVADVYGPQFILELGDNFYFDGVMFLEDPRFELTFEAVYTAKSLQVPWYIIAGNHDHHGNVTAQIAYSSKSKIWNFPNYYYNLEKPIPGGKTLGIIFIDTIQLCGNTHDHIVEQPKGPTDQNSANKQWDFIENSLKKSKADYLFVAGHYPIYSIAEHGPTDCLVKDLLPLLEKYNANGYLSGHEHNLQHLQVNSGVTKGKTIDMFVSGMANFIDSSTSHKESVPSGSIRFHYANPLSLGGFLSVEALSNNMTFTYLDAFGEGLYSTVVYPRK